MAQLTAQIVSYDEEFKRQISHLLRACGVPVGIVEGRSAEGTAPDLVVVDIRADASSGMAAIERLRASSASLAVFVIASAPEPELILQAMRAGANEFFPWSAVDGSPASKAGEESFHGAVRRSAARREAATAGAKPPCVTHAFLGAKGGAGTTTVAINCGNVINACAAAALYAADTIFLVTNPDVPSIRNAQRLVERVRQLGAGSERIKVLLNRVSEQHLIAPKQIETALGYSIHHSFT